MRSDPVRIFGILLSRRNIGWGGVDDGVHINAGDSVGEYAWDINGQLGFQFGLAASERLSTSNVTDHER